MLFRSTTYGGNPFVCAAVSKVFDIYEKDMILTHVQELTPYLEKKLDELVEKHPCAAERRGMGFMQGIVIQGRPVGEVVKKALEKKLLVISAGSDLLRIVPPLVITKTDRHLIPWIPCMGNTIKKFRWEQMCIRDRCMRPLI